MRSRKKINDADKKIFNISGLVKDTDYNTKATEIESKIPSIIGLANTAALTVVENKLSDVSNLAKKADYNAKIADTENKFITTAD